MIKRFADIRILYVVFPLVLVALVYGRSLSLPLYMDDVIYGRYAQSLGLHELFIKLGIVPYYRPLSLVPWKLAELVFGQYPPALLHLFNLLVHAVNGGLLFWLTVRYTQRRLAGLLACAIYLLFPFSYQAIPWAAALGHLMALFGILIALAGLEYLRTGKRLVGVFLWIGAFVAVFSHEIGVIVFPVLILRILTWSKSQRGPFTGIGPSIRWLAPVFGIVALYGALWLLIPRSGDGAQTNVSGLAENLVYLSQGISYQLAAIFGLLVANGHVAAILALSLTMAIFVVWMAFPSPWPVTRTLLFGLAWFWIAVGVPAALLSPEYVIDGPRLMLVASAPVAICWGSLGVPLRPSRTWHFLLHVIAWIIIVWGLIVGTAFINSRMQLHSVLSPLYRPIFEHARQNGRAALTINLPYWIAYRDRTFPLGSEGITYLTTYIGFPDLVYLNTGVWTDSGLLDREDLRVNSPDYWLGYSADIASPEQLAVAIQAKGDAQLLVDVAGELTWATLERQANSPPVTGAREVVFANGLTVYVPERISIGSGVTKPRIRPSLTWSMQEGALPLEPETTVFMQAFCNGEMTGQVDGPPLKGAFPLSLLQSGEYWTEIRPISLDVSAGEEPPDCVLRLGMYSLATGERVPLRAGDADEVVIPLDWAEPPAARGSQETATIPP